MSGRYITRRWLASTGFGGAPDAHLLVPAADGSLLEVWAGVRNPSGALLSELPIGEWSKRARMPSVALRRGDLIAALASRLEDGVVREGVELTSFAQDGRGVRAQFSDGSEERVDALASGA